MIENRSPTTLNISLLEHIDMTTLDIDTTNSFKLLPPIDDTVKYNSIEIMKKVNLLEKFS